MENEVSNSNIKNEVHPWINITLRQDLLSLCDRLRIETSEPIGVISTNTNIPETLLQTVLSGGQLVSDSTILRFYHFFFQKMKGDELGIRHEWVKRKYLSESNRNHGEFDQEIENIIETNNILQILYLDSRLHDLVESEVEQKYGPEGVIGLEVLENIGLIKYNEIKNVFQITDKYFSKRPSLLKKLILKLLEHGLNEKELWGLGENTCYYGMEWVSEETYTQVITILDNAKKQIRDCIKNESGEKTVPMFVVGAVDQYQSSTLGEIND